MASFDKLTRANMKKYMQEEMNEPEHEDSLQVADAGDAFAKERKARADKYTKSGAGVSQGDQAEQSATEFESKAKREAARGSATSRTKAAEMRAQASKLRNRTASNDSDE